MKKKGIDLVVVGSVALDSVATHSGSGKDILGGSVSYACTAAAFFTRPGMVGVVGDDFPRRYVGMLRKAGVDMAGLQQVRGKTFRWAGEYEEDMNNRRTISTELNVFADFRPEVPESYRSAPFVFLANISPDLQLHVLSQMRKPRFVAADTMDLWIKTAATDLRRVISSVDMILLNDSEAKLMTGEKNPMKAAAAVLKMGPKYVVVKKGEHGAILFARNSRFIVPAYPTEDVRDPTGAGDTFAGGLMGALASRGIINADAVKASLLAGTVLASFGVESFGIDRLATIKRRDILRRMDELRRIASFPPARGIPGGAGGK